MCQRRKFVWAFFAPSWFPKDFAPPGVLLGIQALGEVSHFTNLIFSFSKLTNKALLTIWLILGVNSSVGKLSAKEEFATESSSTPLIRFDWKAMACSDSLFVSLRTDKLGWESEPYVTHLLDGFSRLTPIHHIIPLPMIFSPKVSPSPNLLSFFLPPLFSLHQSDKLPPQINFFPHFYITQSSLWVETPYQKCSLNPTVSNFTTKYKNCP